MALAKQREERQKPEEGADLETVDLIDIEETNTATKPSKDDKGDYKAVDNNTNYQL